METIVSIAIPVVFLIMLVVERLIPGRALPKVRFWLTKGFVFFIFTAVVNALVPALLAEALGDRTLLHLQGLGTVAGALVGVLVGDLAGYWIHRTMHSFPTLWRWSHQMHHSAERMDLAGMGYAHPFDTFLSFGLGGLVTFLLGLSPDAAALAGLVMYLGAVAQHSNIKTPSWLGYVVYRPEAHGLHHASGVHAYNYANFPFWDLVFRTFKNPADFPETYGFYPGASARMGAMLMGRDVGEPESVQRTASNVAAVA
ncbi:MAG: sterol desaturase family protein [Polyangiaceae bacterium]